MIRSAKASGEEFPYLAKDMCYIEVFPDGQVSKIRCCNKGEMNEMLNVTSRVSKGTSKLYCAWPGYYETDLFEIDDLSALNQAIISRL